MGWSGAALEARASKAEEGGAEPKAGLQTVGLGEPFRRPQCKDPLYRLGIRDLALDSLKFRDWTGDGPKAEPI